MSSKLTMDEYLIVEESSPEWQEIYRISQLDKTHPLWQNYQNIKLSDYDYMIVNVRNGVPAAFHGIYNNGRWPENTSRICNRAYINPYFRNAGQGLEITANNIKYVLDNYKRWDKDILFISRGVQYENVEISWRKFQKFCDFVIKKTNYDLKFDHHLYKCCPNESRDCYQFCLWYDPNSLKNHDSIPKISQKLWKELP